MGRTNLGFARWLALLLPLALLAGAYVAELGFGLYPCEMCWWQRWPHFAAVALASGGLFAGANGRWLAVAAAVAILISGLIGGFHAGVEYGWWDGLSACAVPTAANGADLLDQIMNAPLQRCDTAPWTLAGVSLAGFNFLLSSGGALLILAMTRRI